MRGPLLRFGACTLDVALRQLTRDGAPVVLQPLVLDLLLHLVEHRDRAVSKDELTTAVWGGRIVSDSALYSRLSVLRAAIGDTDRNRPLVRTVYGSGIRFVGAVEAVADATSTVPSAGPVRPLPTPERRHMTAAVVSLADVGPTDGEPEDFAAWVQDRLAAATDHLVRAGAEVRPLGVDELIAWFGWHVADEDASTAAVAAAAALVDGGAGADLRVGVATGQLLMTPGADGTVAAVGEPARLAAQLARHAGPGQVLVSDLTVRLAGANLALAEDDGVPAAVRGRARRLVRVDPAPSRFAARRARGLAPLVGRAEEVEHLQRRWAAAVAGEGGAVVVTGDAGIGKSRLVHEFVDRLDDDGHQALLLQCAAAHEATPLRPVLTELSRLAALAPQDDDAARREKLARWLGDAPPAIVADLAALVDPRLPGGADPAHLPTRYDAMLRLVVDVVRLLAERRPRLVVVEDAHWCDPSTLDLVRELVDAASTLRLLVVVTSRPAFAAPWIDQPHVSTRALGRLAPAATGQIVAGLAAGALSADARRRIVERADGVPLFAEELTRLVRDRADRDDELGDAIPATIEASVLTRLAALGSAREVAHAAAVVGQGFGAALLEALPLPAPVAIGPALGDLVGARLLEVAGPPGQARYRFRHALIRDAIYRSTPRARRIALHGAVAAALLERFPAVVAAEPERLASHLDEAGAPADAWAYWQRAGERAAGRYAHREAAAHFGRALEALERLPPSPARDRHILEMLEALTTSVKISRGTPAPETRALLDRLERHARAMGDSTRECRSLFDQIQYRYLVGDLDGAEAQLARLIELADRGGHAAFRVGASVHASQLTYYRGAFRASLQAGEAAAASDPLEEALPLPYVRPALQGVGRAAAAACIMGETDRARGHIATLLARQPTGVPSFEAWLWRDVGWAALLLDDADLVEEAAEQMTTICARHGLPVWSYWAPLLRGWALAVRGRAGEGVEAIRAVLAGPDQRYVIVRHCVAPYVLAEAERSAGRPQVALAVVEAALARSVARDATFLDAEFHRLRAQILLDAPARDRSAGLDALAAALDLARAQGAVLFEQRALDRLDRTDQPITQLA